MGRWFSRKTSGREFLHRRSKCLSSVTSHTRKIWTMASLHSNDANCLSTYKTKQNLFHDPVQVDHETGPKKKESLAKQDPDGRHHFSCECFFRSTQTGSIFRAILLIPGPCGNVDGVLWRMTVLTDLDSLRALEENKTVLSSSVVLFDLSSRMKISKKQRDYLSSFSRDL